MTGTWQYLLLVNLYISLFYGFYMLLLQRETFFQLNRAFLLTGLAASFAIPLVQPSWMPSTAGAKQVLNTIQLKGITINGNNSQRFELTDLIAYGYMLGALFFSGRLLYRLWSVRLLLKKGMPISCSFFNKISLGDSITADSPIYTHEMVHIRQWHSVDVLLAELVAIVCWFNPIIYLYKKAVKQLHEFIADREALLTTSKHEYAELLLSQTFETPINTLVNTFFNHSLLKQRIMMIDKERSRRRALIRYALCAPLFILMLGVSTAFAQTDKSAVKAKQTEIVVTAPGTGQSGQGKAGDEVFTAVEQTAEFPGGVQKFYEFLMHNIRYPSKMRQDKVQGRVILSFIVEKDGTLTNFKILRDVGDGAGEESVRVMSLSPKWIPAKQNGHVVREQYTVPIAFALKS